MMAINEPAGLASDGPAAAGRAGPLADAIVAWRDFPWPRRQAFFIRGKRGAGKTHLVTEAMGLPCAGGRPVERERVTWVPLFGVRDIAEIEVRSRASSDLGAQSGGPRILLFEDLERAAIPPADILAFIASLLEHDDLRVFVLVNEDEFDAQDARYAAWKDRIAGPSWLVSPDTDQAFERFLGQIGDDRARDLCRRHGTAIKAIFIDSGFDDLRLLQRALWDFERLWLAAAERHRACEAGMADLLLVVCAMSIELRAKRLEKSLLWRDTWTHYALRSDGGGERRAMSVGDLLRRYPSVRFDIGILSTDCVTDLVLMMDVSPATIQRQLDAHPLFADMASLPSWRALWFSFLLPDGAVPDVLTRFIDDFKARRFRDEDEIRHVAGLCVWLARIGDKNFPPDTLEATLNAYIDEVFDSRPLTDAALFPPAAADAHVGAAFGLMFRCGNDEVFESVSTRLSREVTAWRERGFADAATGLLDLLKRDSQAFQREVCHSISGNGRFARVPLLRLISPERFAVALLALPYGDRINVLSALSNRYDSMPPGGDLAREREWVRMIHDRLSELAQGLVPVARSHFLGQLDHYLGGVVWGLRGQRDGTV
jgi:hypothetical protein